VESLENLAESLPVFKHGYSHFPHTLEFLLTSFDTALIDLLASRSVFGLHQEKLGSLRGLRSSY
ncbi:hypothetical protein, partial [Vibrio harveyi]